MNRFLTGHIVFQTASIPDEPVALPGAYNATVARLQDKRGGPVIGGYIVRVGAALAPPLDPDADLDVSSRNPALWTGVTVTNLPMDPVTFDRLYQINVFDNGGLLGAIQISDLEDTVIRFTLVRIETRTTDAPFVPPPAPVPPPPPPP